MVGAVETMKQWQFLPGHSGSPSQSVWQYIISFNLVDWMFSEKSKDSEVRRTLNSQGAWLAQSVKHPTSAQVVITLLFVGSSPPLGSQ